MGWWLKVTDSSKETLPVEGVKFQNNFPGMEIVHRDPFQRETDDPHRDCAAASFVAEEVAVAVAATFVAARQPENMVLAATMQPRLVWAAANRWLQIAVQALAMIDANFD